MERGAVTFDDVAVYFTEEEWLRLQEDERNLYKEVMSDNYQMILSLNRPDLITNIELGCEPYITTAQSADIPDSWRGDSSVFEEDTPPAPPVKRCRRYPRVNPLRWVKSHKKIKLRAARASGRLVLRGHEAQEEEEEPSRLHTGRRWATTTGDVMFRPDLRVTLNISEMEEPEHAWGKGQGSLTAAPAPDPAEIVTITTDEPEVLPERVEVTTLASPWRREKHVQFSDTVTTFLFGDDDAQSIGELKSNCRPCPGHVTGVLRTREEPAPQDPESNTTHGTLGGGDLTTPDFSIEKTEEAEGPPPCDPTEPSPSTGPRVQPEKRDVGTQIDMIHKEEDLQAEVQLTPPPPLPVPAPAGQNVVKSYSCSNCGKTTHWTKLNEQQKADVLKPSYIHVCTMCRRQRQKNNSPKRMGAPRANTARGPAAKRPHASPPGHSSINGPATKKRSPANQNVQTQKGEGSPRTSTNHNVQLKKGEESPRTSTNRNVLLKKGVESPRTSTSHNVQLKKGEESPRTSTNHNVQLKKGEESPRTSTNHNVHLKGEESPSTPTSHNVQLKKGEESPSTSTSHNVQLKKGEETPRTSTNRNILLKKGEESPRTVTNHNIQMEKGEESTRSLTHLNIQLKKGEESPRTSTNRNVKSKKGEESPSTVTNHNIQMEKGEESTRTSTSHNVQLKKGVESPRTSTNRNVFLNKGEESPRTGTNHDIQLKKGEESPRTSTSHNVQLKKGEESPKASTNRNIQLKKGEESPRTSTNRNVFLNKGEESPRTVTNHDIQLKKVEESPKASTNRNMQLKKGEESPRTSAIRNAQLKEGEEETLVTSTNLKAQLKITDPSKTRFAAQDVHSLCIQCGAAEGAELHHKVKSIHGTTKRATNAPSSPDLRSSTPERRKGNKVLQNGASSVHEEKLSPASRSSRGPNSQKKCDRCTKCGKRLVKGQNLKPLSSIQHKRPLRGRSAIITQKVHKRRAKSDAGRRERARKSPDGRKEKKPRSTGVPKTPKPARGARDKVLCTKCGKRVALHVPPSQDGPNEGGGNENECVVLLRKKRKRPLDGMEPFTCKECGKIFTRHFTLLQHRLIHTGERPYACKVCGKTFRDGSYLIVHMRSHTKEKPYRCTQCGKCFSQNSALHVHLRTHSDERPFACQECGKSFADRSTYRHHMRIHTGEKPYACSFCGKRFTQQPHVKRHETIHTGERPFECVQCGKRFIEKTKLKKHELVHKKGKD